MPRRKLIYSKEWAYHVTARVNNREVFPGDLSFCWGTICIELQLQATQREIRIHALVLMPNHFHLILTTPEAPISEVMRSVMSSSTKIINAYNGRTGHLFGGRYHWSLITSRLYYSHALKYVLRNPVKAGLADSAAAYPFSSYPGSIGMTHQPLTILPPLLGLEGLVPSDIEEFDQWVNEPQEKEANEAIKKALKRKVFKLPVKRHKKKIFELKAEI
jgi:REP element-mobilizing transposase RayT